MKTNEKTMIETPQLRLIPCELRHFEAILYDRRRLERVLGVTVFDDAFEFPGVASIETMRFMQKYLKANPDALGWWTYLFIHVEDETLIGTGGFKGKADEAGMVEIGYAIVPAYRHRGLATEAARGLVDHAFAHAHLKRIDAHTLAERNASARVLEKVGMGFMGVGNDPDEGEVWHWSLHRGLSAWLKCLAAKPVFVVHHTQEDEGGEPWNKYRLQMMRQLLGLIASRHLRARASSVRATGKPLISDLLASGSWFGVRNPVEGSPSSSIRSPRERLLLHFIATRTRTSTATSSKGAWERS